ncbi:MAG: tRNA lysidine(34) synthetase TilS, partial [Armatimonadetes bacterium 13_1_40CM_3_65_7]
MDRSREDRVTSHQSPVTRHGEWLLDDVRRTIERFGLLRPDNTVVVAVSGGADSVALLHLLADLRHEYALVLRVAHLNHRLRPDAGADAEFVRQTATNLAIPITVEEVDVSARAAAQKRSLEDAGRQARYEFFARVAGMTGAGCIATAHTQDDQVETVAMRLLQGAAWETLAGIPTSRRLGEATVVRPLIETTRAEILRYLQDRRATWRDDPTNRDQRFLRNWVRLTWLPVLEARHPQIRGLLSEAGRLAGASDKFFEETASMVLGQAHREGQTIQFPLGALRDLPQN